MINYEAIIEQLWNMNYHTYSNQDVVGFGRRRLDKFIENIRAVLITHRPIIG